MHNFLTSNFVSVITFHNLAFSKVSVLQHDSILRSSKVKVNQENNNSRTSQLALRSAAVVLHFLIIMVSFDSTLK